MADSFNAYTTTSPEAPTDASFPRQLAEGLWVLGNPYFHLFLVKGEQAAALVEVGVSAIVDDVIRQLDELRVEPHFLIVTHPHPDHLTGLAGLRERYRDALVVVGEGTLEFLAHPSAWESIIAEDKVMGQFLASRGFRPGRPPIEELPHVGDALVAADHDEMDLGGRTLRFLEAKGHAPGNITVYVPEIEAVLASDSMGFSFPQRGFYPIFFTSFSGYVATIDRLAALRPRILGTAHQGPRSDAEAIRALEEARKHAVAMRDRIRADNRDPDTIAQALFDEWYSDVFLLYSPENILGCCRLLVKRSKE
ncbi:MAG: MBL fold metallo-hydrolase [Desulfomonile sp.]|nr:MBL fold metallo-hydrolase [Desulfomonile sp.]